MMRVFAFALLVAYAHALLSPLPWSARQIECESDAVCKEKGNSNCGCVPNANICIDAVEFSKGLKGCPTCTDSTQCAGLDNTCNVTLPEITTGTICSTCSVNVVAISALKCETPSSTVSSGTKQKKAVCVSTKWVKERGLQHATLREFPTPADVLCIPELAGLPCATPGHMLRACTGESCQLLTYREICDSRADCVASTMRVSQLSHTWDWAQHYVESSLTRFELTSVSASSNALSSSRMVARIADNLNRAQLGYLCNMIAVLSFRIEATLRLMLFAAKHVSS